MIPGWWWWRHRICQAWRWASGSVSQCTFPQVLHSRASYLGILFFVIVIISENWGKKELGKILYMYCPRLINCFRLSESNFPLFQSQPPPRHWSHACHGHSSIQNPPVSFTKAHLINSTNVDLTLSWCNFRIYRMQKYIRGTQSGINCILEPDSGFFKRQLELGLQEYRSDSILEIQHRPTCSLSSK